jgi:uncharacterized protein YkwD
MHFRYYPVSLFFLLFFILILTPPSFSEGGPSVLQVAKGPPQKPAEHSDPEARLILLMNQTRTKMGLRPLKPSRILGEVARSYSHEMSVGNLFSHTNPDGLGPLSILF